MHVAWGWSAPCGSVLTRSITCMTTALYSTASTLHAMMSATRRNHTARHDAGLYIQRVLSQTPAPTRLGPRLGHGLPWHTFRYNAAC